MSLTKAIEELKKFSNEVLTLNDPIESNKIADLEIQLAVPLPPDYKKLLEMHNGINLFGTEVFGISTDSDPFALKEVYLFEHYEVANEMPYTLFHFHLMEEGIITVLIPGILIRTLALLYSGSMIISILIMTSLK